VAQRPGDEAVNGRARELRDHLGGLAAAEAGPRLKGRLCEEALRGGAGAEVAQPLLQNGGLGVR